MKRYIDTSRLPQPLRDQLEKHLLLDEEHLMSMREVSKVYGYSYQTVRFLVCKKQVKANGGKPVRISHKAMREYIEGRKCVGRPLKDA